MKTTGRCPKCSGEEIMRVPGRPDAFGAGNNIPLGTAIFSAVNSVKVMRYVCAACGFSEEWISRANIPHLKKQFKTSKKRRPEG